MEVNIHFHGGGHRLQIVEVTTFEKVDEVLLLIKEEMSIRIANMNPQEIVYGAQISNGELDFHLVENLFDNTFVRTNDHHIIYVD